MLRFNWLYWTINESGSIPYSKRSSKGLYRVEGFFLIQKVGRKRKRKLLTKNALFQARLPSRREQRDLSLRQITPLAWRNIPPPMKKREELKCFLSLFQRQLSKPVNHLILSFHTSLVVSYHSHPSCLLWNLEVYFDSWCPGRLPCNHQIWVYSYSFPQ